MNKLNSKKYKAYDPKFLFKGELRRGMGVSSMSGILSNTLNTVLLNLGFNPISSTLLSLIIFGNLFTYCFDILLAKEKFFIPDYKGQTNFFGNIPYNEIKTRFIWLLNSLYKKYFLRYLITIIIDSIIGLSILEYIIKKLDENKILLKHEVKRNALVGGLVAITTFILYLNKLRFQWAYKNEEDPLMNTMVLMWLTILIVIYLGFKLQAYNFKEKDE